jgi:hypothetical protein
MTDVDQVDQVVKLREVSGPGAHAAEVEVNRVRWGVQSFRGRYCHVRVWSPVGVQLDIPRRVLLLAIAAMDLDVDEGDA